MSKKGKIITTIICVVCLLSGIITGVIVASMKIFNISSENPQFYNHTEFIKLNYDKNKLIEVDENYYSNGIKIVSNSDNLCGLYSFVEDKLILDTIYNNITPIEISNDKTFFKAEKGGNFLIFDEFGNNTKLTFIENNKTYAYKNFKKINHKENKNSVKVTIDSDFDKEKIEINNITYKSLNDYNYTKNNYFSETLNRQNINYEIWQIQSKDNVTFNNIYEIENNKRNLIQTIDLSEGISLDKHDLLVYITTYNKPIFYSIHKIENSGDCIDFRLTAYDKNFNEQGSSIIKNTFFTKVTKSFRIENNVFFQVLTRSTDKDYNFYKYDESLDKFTYYKFETWKLDLTNARLKQVEFEYLINSVISHNDYVAQIIVSNIENKRLKDTETFIVNKKLQTKHIDYLFDRIIKLTSNRFLAYHNNEVCLINKKYEIITSIGVVQNIFTTTDSIIINKESDISYVCNFDGILLKKYNKSDIFNINSSRYYLVRELFKDEHENQYYSYFLEQCGLREQTSLFSKMKFSEQEFIPNGYEDLKIQMSKDLNIVIKIKLQDNGYYTYEIYNFENKYLGSISQITSKTLILQITYSNDKCVIFNMNGNLCKINK